MIKALKPYLSQFPRYKFLLVYFSSALPLREWGLLCMQIYTDVRTSVAWGVNVLVFAFFKLFSLPKVKVTDAADHRML
jgi:hypothetical protein